MNYLLNQSLKHSYFGLRNVSNYTSKNVRAMYLDYFVNKNEHTFVPSYPVLPPKDKSLLFTNSGMIQFKSIFLGTEPVNSSLGSLKRAANSQKCIRAGGKHNDLDDVGLDHTHHTFFEMLGSWSFGDYSKEKACQMAWEVLTKVYNLPTDRLYVTYFGGDKKLNLEADYECRDIWLQIGVDPHHILPCGMKSNFWEMADKGPCGPCTEIHYDHLGGPGRHSMVNKDSKDMVEIWNLVFIQYDKQDDRKLVKLNSHFVDTGMGLERLTAILQGSMSNYETDLFHPIFQHIQKFTNKLPYQGQDTSLDIGYRILADHARMFSVAIADGVLPDAFEAGNVLRKIIKKAIYIADTNFSAKPGIVASLADPVVESLGSAFPELITALPKIKNVVNEEEDRFRAHLQNAHKELKRLKSSSSDNKLSGDQAFDLLIRYGLQKDMINDLCHSHDLSVNWPQFHGRVNIEKIKSSNHLRKKQIRPSTKVLEDLSHIPLTDDSLKYNYTLCGEHYRYDPVVTHVRACIQGDQVVEQMCENEGWLILDKTNFYAEAGGQDSDKGFICGKDWNFIVDKVIAIKGQIFHHGHVEKGIIKPLSTAHPSFDIIHRLGCMRNHTASHLIMAAFRQVLPDHKQKSAHLGEEHLRYSYSAKQALSVEQLEQIEDLVNQSIQQQLPVERSMIKLDVALKDPEIGHLSDDVYPHLASSVKIGRRHPHSALSSVDLCCGTHVHNTEHIGQLVIMSEKSIGQNERSLVAITGKYAQKALEISKEIVEEVIQANNNFVYSTLEPEKASSQALLEVKRIRKNIHALSLPLISRLKLEANLTQLDYKAKIMQKQVQKEKIISEAKKELEHVLALNQKSTIVHCLETLGEKNQLLNFLKGFTMSWTDKPSVIGFLTPNNKKVIWQAIVPAAKVTPSFSAEQWLQSIATIVDGEMEHTNYSSTYVVMHGRQIENLDEALKVLSSYGS